MCVSVYNERLLNEFPAATHDNPHSSIQPSIHPVIHQIRGREERQKEKEESPVKRRGEGGGASRLVQPICMQISCHWFVRDSKWNRIASDPLSISNIVMSRCLCSGLHSAPVCSSSRVVWCGAVCSGPPLVSLLNRTRSPRHGSLVGLASPLVSSVMVVSIPTKK